MNKVIITAKIDKVMSDTLGTCAQELQVSKSWIIQQALKQYFDKFEEHLADMRIASIGESLSHEKVLKEYGLSG